MKQTTIGGNPVSFGTSNKDRRESDVEITLKVVLLAALV